MSAIDAQSKCHSADVVLVWDTHDKDLCRRAFGRAVDALGARRGAVAVLLEAVPAGLHAKLVEGVREGATDPERLRAVLRQCCTWPVEAYADLLLRFHAQGIELLAGRESEDDLAKCLPDGSPDKHRRPVRVRDADRASHRTSMSERHEFVVASLAKWLKDNSLPGRVRPRAFVLFGGMHLAGYPGSLRSALQERGYSCVVLVPVEPTLELVLREELGPVKWRDWIQLLPGVYRPGLVKDAEWLAAAGGERERFDWLVDRIAERVRLVRHTEDVKDVQWMLGMLGSVNAARARPILKSYVELPALAAIRTTLLAIIEQLQAAEADADPIRPSKR